MTSIASDSYALGSPEALEEILGWYAAKEKQSITKEKAEAARKIFFWYRAKRRAKDAYLEAFIAKYFTVVHRAQREGKPIALSQIKYWNFGETHCDDHHAIMNAFVIDSLFKCGDVVFTEEGDTTLNEKAFARQIPFQIFHSLRMMRWKSKEMLAAFWDSPKKGQKLLLSIEEVVLEFLKLMKPEFLKVDALKASLKQFDHFLIPEDRKVLQNIVTEFEKAKVTDLTKEPFTLVFMVGYFQALHQFSIVNQFQRVVMTFGDRNQSLIDTSMKVSQSRSKYCHFYSISGKAHLIAHDGASPVFIEAVGKVRKHFESLNSIILIPKEMPISAFPCFLRKVLIQKKGIEKQPVTTHQIRDVINDFLKENKDILTLYNLIKEGKVPLTIREKV
jgi:hypothetical protein